MQIRQASDDDWVGIYPFFAAIGAAGDSHAYPEGLSLDAARPLWMATAPGRTVVAVDGMEIPGSAKMGPNRPGRGAHVATASFMVDPACPWSWGRSCARRRGGRVGAVRGVSGNSVQCRGRDQLGGRAALAVARFRDPGHRVDRSAIHDTPIMSADDVHMKRPLGSARLGISSPVHGTTPRGRTRRPVRRLSRRCPRR